MNFILAKVSIEGESNRFVTLQRADMSEQHYHAHNESFRDSSTDERVSTYDSMLLDWLDKISDLVYCGPDDYVNYEVDLRTGKIKVTEQGSTLAEE